MTKSKKRIVVLSGAGVSAESGINTFRDSDGLWEGHDIMEVASPQGWQKNRELVLDFYNKRRRQLKQVSPNAAHRIIAELQENFDVYVITQNVDDLHERAGSQQVIHLHGELKKVRSTADPQLVLDWEEDCSIGDHCKNGSQLRPHIVWFGEDVPLLQKAVQLIQEADIIIVLGTSMQVYPAAGLVSYAPSHSQVFYVDPRPSINYELSKLNHLEIISEPATIGMQKLKDKIKNFA